MIYDINTINSWYTIFILIYVVTLQITFALVSGSHVSELHSKAQIVREYALSLGNCKLVMQKTLSRTIGGYVFRELQIPFTLKASYLDFKKELERCH